MSVVEKRRSFLVSAVDLSRVGTVLQAAVQPWHGAASGATNHPTNPNPKSQSHLNRGATSAGASVKSTAPAANAQYACSRAGRADTTPEAR